MPSAIIFDLDGTLLDTLSDLADSMNDALRSLGFPTHPLAAYQRFVGDGAQILASRAIPLPHQGDPIVVQAAYEHYLNAYERRWHFHSPAYPGVADILDACVSKGILLAVYSNKSDRFAGKVVERLLPQWPWKVVRGQLPEVPKKPSPEGALLVAESLGVNPEDCWFVGDSAVDIACAKGASMRSFGALWGFRGLAELKEAQADVLLDQPTDLLSYI